MEYYFVRVNGKTRHDNPKDRNCFVNKEPEEFKRDGYSNYLNFCFENNIVRMGWPDVGDLSKGNRFGAKSNCYSLESLDKHIQEYLREFYKIEPGSILLVPNRDRSGDIYICTVVSQYYYEINGPYECSHRLKVSWNRDSKENPIRYTIEQLGISKGGWWLRAFHKIEQEEIISRIKSIR